MKHTCDWKERQKFNLLKSSLFFSILKSILTFWSPQKKSSSSIKNKTPSKKKNMTKPFFKEGRAASETLNDRCFFLLPLLLLQQLQLYFLEPPPKKHSKWNKLFLNFYIFFSCFLLQKSNGSLPPSHEKSSFFRHFLGTCVNFKPHPNPESDCPYREAPKGILNYVGEFCA